MFDLDLALVHELEEGGHVGRRRAVKDHQDTGAVRSRLEQVLEMLAARR